MESVGLFEAKTHLSEIVLKVEQGQEFLITRHGRPVAKIVPAEPKESGLTREQAIKDLLAFRDSQIAKGKGATTEEILAWRHEGHRY